MSEQPKKVNVKPEPKVVDAGNAAPKRVFVPNVAVKREKKEHEIEKPVENKRQFAPNVSSRGRGRGGRQQNLIQTKSIFEAGPGEAARKSDKSFASSSERVVGNVSSNISNNSTATPGVIKNEILLDDTIKEEIGNFLKLESIKDKEPLKRSQSLDDLDVLRTSFIRTNDEDELNDDFFLFQTVDCLKLTELPEGKIGKLKIYKSGKIELCLGNNIKLDVSLASDASFLQDVINIEIDETNESTGTMTCIGHIKNKILCTPQF